MKIGLDRWTPEALWARYGDAVFGAALNLIAAIAILIVGLWIAAAAARGVRRLARRHPRLDATLIAFLANGVRYAIVAFVALAVLHRFGVETTSIIAVLGAATLAIGLALQGTLSNVAAGVMLVLFRPYRLGDFVQTGGQQGVVKDISLFTTELATLDNVKVVLPNALCWGAPILNYSAHPKRRTDLTFAVAYDSDLDLAIETIRQAIVRDTRVLAEPPPVVKASALGDFSVTILARYWCDTAHALDLKMDLMRAVKAALDQAGVEIPYPTSVQIAAEDRQPARKRS